MNKDNITDIFFDLDHTLWDFDKNSNLTFIKIFKLNKLEIDIDVFLEAYHPINTNYWNLYRENKKFHKFQRPYHQIKLSALVQIP